MFFEAIRLVCELRPRVVVLENVAGLLTRGLDRVLGTLAEIGYDAEWHCIPAAAVGAPHIRDRVFVIAYAISEGLEGHAGHVCNGNKSRRVETEFPSTNGTAIWFREKPTRVPTWGVMPLKCGVSIGPWVNSCRS